MFRSISSWSRKEEVVEAEEGKWRLRTGVCAVTVGGVFGVKVVKVGENVDEGDLLSLSFLWLWLIRCRRLFNAMLLAAQVSCGSASVLSFECSLRSLL